MDDVDLSTWLGKPPLRQKIQHQTTEGAQSAGDSSHGQSVTEQVEPVDLCESDTEHETEECDDLAAEEVEALFRGSSSKLQNGVFIDIPRISNKEDYEHLPGHFTVDRVLSEYSQDKYLVKLGSGEVELLSSRQLRFTDNGPTSLKAFLAGNMGSRSRPNSRRPQTNGLVDWTSLAISDSDNSVAQRSNRPLRTKDTTGSSDTSESEGEPQSSTDDEDDSEPSMIVGRRSARICARRQEQDLRNGYTVDSEDDSDDRPRGPGRLRTKHIQQSLTSRRSKRVARRSGSDSDSNLGAVGARRSERTRGIPRRNMRERQEDEISANSENETAPKVVAIKEHFRRLSEHHPFRQRHRQVCDTCDWRGDDAQKGPLLFCQGCTNAYHKLCLGPRGSRDHLVTKVAENNFVLQCRRCIGLAHQKDHTAPDQGVCVGCGESGKVSKPLRARLSTRQEQLQREENGGRDPITIVDIHLNAIENVMFRCASCHRGWHMQHLPKKEEAHQNELEDEEVNGEQLAQRRFDSYHRAWTCKDCVENQSQIDALIAWRPVDIDNYIPGMTVDMVAETAKEYLVKWKNQSHFRTTWMPGDWVWGIAAASMRTAFMKKDENRLPKMTTQDAIPEDFFRVDILFDVRYTSVRKRTKEIDLARAKEVDTAYMKFKGLGYEDTIWETPPRPEDGERWLDFKTAYEEWVLKRYISIPPRSSLRRHLEAIRCQNFEHALMKRAQPSSMTGGQMMDYQMEGLNWLYYQWFINQNAILADEMGLGKTIQIIAFFATLVQDHKCWPFLVVVPNSTCPNWRREIRKWVPSLRAVTYFGSEKARKLTHDYELFPKEDEDERRYSKHKKSNAFKDIKAHVVITSYESIVEEKVRKSLQNVPWAGLIVDEGQRLKNDKTQIYDALSKMGKTFKVLLTGTPLQNNARELFNLLQFLDSKNVNAVAMEAKYETLTPENVPELHDLIRPFFLRRTKVQVLTFLPPMAQIILPVTMSLLQKKVYKSILSKNPQLMKAIFSRDGQVASKERHSLNNILMQLRKTLCHPFVYSREIEERSYEMAVSHRNLVEASSKLQLLSIMLPKLQKRGHRVLIFSQFLDNLDIVEDFLDGLGLQHCRLDGSINSLDKQKRIDEFNAHDSPYFAFLLSTRAGGVGINLATADTVIIMDPDFNPHQDIQALSRAHRIGQKKKVLVFQMMTRGSVEEKIMQIGKKKMALDHILIQQMDQEDEAGMDLESILRHGAGALFEDDNTGDIHYDSASVDKLLDRSQLENTGTGDDQSAESQFSFARIWANDRADLQDSLGNSGDSTPNPTLWDKILEERERAYAEEAALRAETLGRGKRRRQNVNYGQDNADRDILSPVRFPKRVRTENASDTDFQAQDADSDENDTEGYDSGYNLREEGANGEGASEHMPATSAAVTKLAVKGKATKPREASKNYQTLYTPVKPTHSTDKPVSPAKLSRPSKSPNPFSPVKSSKRPIAYFSTARPFKRVKVPSGSAPRFNGDGPSDYVPLGGLPPTHLCFACEEVHPMGWCRLKIAGVEHCGFCGLAHVGHGRTCPHLQSEVQVATLLGTLKEGMESRELIEQETKYLKMIGGGT